MKRASETKCLIFKLKIILFFIFCNHDILYEHDFAGYHYRMIRVVRHLRCFMVVLKDMQISNTVCYSTID